MKKTISIVRTEQELERALDMAKELSPDVCPVQVYDGAMIFYPKVIASEAQKRGAACTQLFELLRCDAQTDALIVKIRN